VGATAASEATDQWQRTEGAMLLGALPAMHFGWGFGTLAGMLRFGPPLASFAHLLGRADGSRTAEETEPVYAPSLQGEQA
jgi:hypothetical protein